MDDSDKGDASDASSAPGAAAPTSSQMPIGGMVRDPREVKTNPSLTRFLRERLSTAFVGTLVKIGVLRPRTATGELGPRSWKGLFFFVGSIFVIVFVWTSIHIVQPGNVAVPVTFGHAGEPLDSGFHITLPFTTAYSLSTRTQNYTMSSNSTDGPKGSVDSAVQVLGQDGGAASVNATVLYRLDPTKATTVYRNLGRNYSAAVVRPAARGCVRDTFTKYPVVIAATGAGNTVESDVGQCIKARLVSQGIMVSDFQLKQVTLDPQLQVQVTNKVKAQQLFQQQLFDEATAEKQADIKRIQALATSDSEQLIECGGKAATVTQNGKLVQTIIPNPPTACSGTHLSQAFLQFTYIQALQALAASGSNSTLVLPFDKNLTPLINLPSGGSSSTATP
jgi:regulator of protease activity HflC (stomatin/prohibitin superfamily)